MKQRKSSGSRTGNYFVRDLDWCKSTLNKVVGEIKRRFGDMTQITEWKGQVLLGAGVSYQTWAELEKRLHQLMDLSQDPKEHAILQGLIDQVELINMAFQNALVIKGMEHKSGNFHKFLLQCTGMNPPQIQEVTQTSDTTIQFEFVDPSENE